MWYDTGMPTTLPQREIDRAAAAVDYAAQVRIYHRRRSALSSPDRLRDINLALSRLKEAMRPLKTEIGRFQYGPTTSIAEANREIIRQCSLAIQTERRKLWKLKHPIRKSDSR